MIFRWERNLAEEKEALREFEMMCQLKGFSQAMTIAATPL